MATRAYLDAQRPDRDAVYVNPKGQAVRKDTGTPIGFIHCSGDQWQALTNAGRLFAPYPARHHAVRALIQAIWP